MNPVPYGVHPAMGGPTPPHMMQQQQQQQQMQQGGGIGVAGAGVAAGRGSNTMGAWQPAAPTSLQQASAPAGSYHQQAPFGRGAGAAPNAGANPNQGYHHQFHNPYYASHSLPHHASQQMQQHQPHNPYNMGAMQGVTGRPGVPGASAAPSSSWQPLHPTAPQHYGSMYYPPGPNPQMQLSQPQQQQLQQQQQQLQQPNNAQLPNMQPHVAPPPREKKIPVITVRCALKDS